MVEIQHLYGLQLILSGFLQGSSTNLGQCMAVPLRTRRVIDGGITDAHDATTAYTVLEQSSR